MPEWSSYLRGRLSSLQLSPERETEIVEELSQHLDDRYEELVAGGASDVDARHRALEELRDHEALASGMRGLRQTRVAPPIPAGGRQTNLVADLWQDIRYAARMLRKQPGFTAAAVATLALGIGANTAIFSLVNATLLQRLPVTDRERLVHTYRGDVGGAFSYPLYATLRDSNDVFDAYAAWAGIAVSFSAESSVDLIPGYIVTGNFFDVLGVRPALGRLISTADDVTPGAHPVAVIGHQFWQTRFGGRPDIVGREIRLNGQVFTIIGVAAAGFGGPVLGSTRGLYVPMMMQAVVRPPRQGYSGEQNPDLLKHPTNSWLFGIGRLKRGVAVEQARARLGTLTTTFFRTRNPSAPPIPVALMPIDDPEPAERQRMQSAAWLLAGVVGAVLLIACANIANLLLSRAASRRRELAVRLAIGANRARIVRQLLTESVLLAFIGGAAGVGLAWAVVQGFQLAPPPPGALPIVIDFAIDSRVLWFSLVLACATSIVFGLVPALKASKPAVVPALKDSSASDERSARFTLKQALVVAEVALSLVLLITAGLFVRSLQTAHAIDPGFDAERLVTAPLDVNLLRYTRTQGREFYQRVVERVEQLPGVEAATVARVAVLTGGGRVLSFHIEGRDMPDDQVRSEGSAAVAANRREVNANVIGPRYFTTLGIPLLLGRDFDDRDTEGRPLVAIVNETIVRVHFGGTSPVGTRVSFEGAQGPWREIVGVVRDSKYATLGEDPLPIAYMPVAQNHETGMRLYARASVPPAALISSVRREIQSLEPNLPLPATQTMSETIGTSLYAARMGAWMLAVFGGLALLLAAVGIYGVLSFAISRRTREMGIRVALGAETRDVFLLVIRDGMLLVGIGVAIGIAGGLAGGRSLASFLYGISTSDLPTYAATTTILGAVALAACIIPARRAMRVSPIVALRYE